MLWWIALLLTLAYYGFLFRWEAKQKQASKQAIEELAFEEVSSNKAAQESTKQGEEEVPIFGPSETFSVTDLYGSEKSKQHRLSPSNEEKSIANDAIEVQLEFLGNELLKKERLEIVENAKEKTQQRVHRQKI